MASTTAAADVSVQADVRYNGTVIGSLGYIMQGVVARAQSGTEATNNVLGVWWFDPTTFRYYAGIFKIKAGAVTVVGYSEIATVNTSAWYTLRLDITAAGVASVYWGARGSTLTLAAQGQDADLATGGTLASGKRGFYDACTSGNTINRWYDNVIIADSLPSSGHVLNSGKSAELRHDRMIYEPSSGSNWSDVPAPEGAHLKLPPAGREDLAHRMAACAHRLDLDSGLPATNIADALRVGPLEVTPRVMLTGRS